MAADAGRVRRGAATPRSSGAPAVALARTRLRAANAGGNAAPRPGAYRRPPPEPGAPPVGVGIALLARLTDDRMLVGVFRLMLAIAVCVLALDLRAMVGAVPSAPGASPALVPRLLPSFLSDPPALDLPRIGPVRLPSVGSPPPHELRADPEVLRAPLTIDLVPGGTLVLRGTIDPGAAARLVAELDARGEYVALVSLDSPGGSVVDALAMSALLRERGTPVRVEAGALCASSCPLVLAGGAVREVSDTASVGVHQIFADGLVDDGMARAQETTARIGRHLATMGVDGALWLHALETSKDRLYYLTPDEMTGYGLATVIVESAAVPPGDAAPGDGAELSAGD